MTIKPASPRKIDIYDALERKIRMGLNCVQVGVVQEFNTETQLASVKIAMKQVVRINEDGTQELREYPLLLECPTFVLSGSNDFISFPISEGDNCLVLFNDRDIDTWLNAGDGGFPTTVRAHDLADAFCLVGVRPLTASIATYLADGIRISHDVGAIIDLKDNLIESAATLFRHDGNMEVTGNVLIKGDTEIEQDLLVRQGMTVLGTVEGNASGDLNIDADIVQSGGREIRAGNGASGTFNIVTVVDGIVISGS